MARPTSTASCESSGGTSHGRAKALTRERLPDNTAQPSPVSTSRPEGTGQPDEGQEGILVQAGQMKREGMNAARGGGRLPVVPPVRAEGVPDRARRVDRQRRDGHAPAGSAGGVPRRGARAGDAPGFVGVLACGGRVERRQGGTGWQGLVLHQPVEIVAVDGLALQQRSAIRSSSSRLPEMIAMARA